MNAEFITILVGKISEHFVAIRKGIRISPILPVLRNHLHSLISKWNKKHKTVFPHFWFSESKANSIKTLTVSHFLSEVPRSVAPFSITLTTHRHDYVKNDFIY